MGWKGNDFVTRLTVRRTMTSNNQKNMAITAVPTRIMTSRFVFSWAPGKTKLNEHRQLKTRTFLYKTTKFNTKARSQVYQLGKSPRQ